MRVPLGAVGTGRATGKLILCGEHAVVYGYPAIAIGVDRSTTVTLHSRPGPLTISSPHRDERLVEALRGVLPEEDLAVEVQTDLPVGRGMGSSAALAVALVRAIAQATGERPAPQEVYERAMRLERTFHGNPSGVDVLVSTYGGCRWFRKGDPPEHRALVPGPFRIVVLDSGEAGDTAQLVAGVASRRPGIDALLEEIGALVQAASAALQEPERLGPLLTRNHELLRGIGVSNDTLDGYVDLALRSGAYGAKLAGAGGGGVVLAIVGEAAERGLLAAASDRGIPAFSCAPSVT